MAYGQFGEEAKLNLIEEIETLRSTVKVVGNNVVMERAQLPSNGAEDKILEDEDEESDSPSSSQALSSQVSTISPFQCFHWLTLIFAPDNRVILNSSGCQLGVGWSAYNISHIW